MIDKSWYIKPKERIIKRVTSGGIVARKEGETVYEPKHSKSNMTPITNMDCIVTFFGFNFGILSFLIKNNAESIVGLPESRARLEIILQYQVRYL